MAHTWSSGEGRVFASLPYWCPITSVVPFEDADFANAQRSAHPSSRGTLVLHDNCVVLLSGFDLNRDLLDPDYYEFRRFKGSKAHADIHNAQVDIVLGSGLVVALHEVCVMR